ncbi:MAG: HAD family hydrolase [Acholeplasmatales bacterium]|nr:HAD family hydrolase [Acholeplasmatales bacterium]
MITVKNLIDIKKYVNNLEVVVFDLDDTLYNEVEYVKSGFKEIASNYPNVDNMYEKLFEAFKNGKKAIDYVLCNEGMMNEKDNCLKIYRNHVPNISLSKDIISLLNDLKEKKLGLITDGRPEGQRAKIIALGLEKYFKKIIITDELGGIEFRKPNEKAFVLMKESFNCSYDEMVYIGDNINKDFIAPEKLGMKTIFFNNKEGLYR